MGVQRHILHDAGDLDIGRLVHPEHLPHRVPVAEVFFCHRLGQHEHVRLCERRGGIALEKFPGKDGKDRRIDKEEPRLLEMHIPLTQEQSAGAEKPDRFEHRLRKIVPDQRPERWRDMAEVKRDRTVLIGPLAGETVNPVRLLMVPVVTQFILDVEHDQDAARHPDRQSEDIDEGIPLVLDQVANRNLQVIGNHTRNSF